MTPKIFQTLLLDSFPTNPPDPSRLFEGIRTESGCEKLEFLVHVQWPSLTLEMLDGAAGEFWQMSSVWTKYFLPAFMSISTNTELEFDKFGELSERQEDLMTCLFSYWCSIDYFQHETFDVTKSIFHNLTSRQIDCLKQWLFAIDFKALDKAAQLPIDFDYTEERLSEFIEKVRRFSA